MKNKDWYQKTFSKVQPSRDYLAEVEQMKKTRKFYIPRTVAAACAAGVLLVGVPSAAYAADIGGIQRQVQIWTEGEKTDAVLDIKGDGSYEMTYKDKDGKTQERSGGGVAYEPDGTERPLTEAEIMEDLANQTPEVEYNEDGTVEVYYQDQKIDITDKFDKDGICYVTIKGEKENYYMTIKYQEGDAISTKKYVSADEFNNGYEE